MFKYEILIKSGTCGHYSYDDCSMSVCREFKSSIPLSVGDTLEIDGKNYIVNEIVVSDMYDYNECYVLRIYDGEDKQYIDALDFLAETLIDNPDTSVLEIQNFAKKWVRDRKNGLIV